MATIVIMPKLGLTMTEGKIEKWAKNEGDPVKEKEVIVCVETEKISYEYESPASGILRKILRKVDDVVPVTEPIAIIAGPEEDISQLLTPQMSVPEQKMEMHLETKPESVERREIRIVASPLAKKIAAEKGVELSRVSGTGPGGRITKEDVLKHLEKPTIPKEPVAGLMEKRETVDPFISSKIIPLNEIKRIVGRRMTESARNIPQFHLSVEVEMTQLIELRRKLLEIGGEKGPRITITDLLIRIVAQSLKKCPQVNSSFEDTGIRLIQDINVGVAMAGPDGLVVPVVHRANEISVEEIAVRTKELSQKLQKGTLAFADIVGGTFTLSNLGMYGIDVFDAIINPPQSAILAVGRVSDRPVVINGKVEVRPMAWATVSVDHRALDGKEASDFLAYIKKIIQNPLLLI